MTAPGATDHTGPIRPATGLSRPLAASAPSVTQVSFFKKHLKNLGKK